MSLNIKNPRVHELARQAARLRGTNQTAVIEEALELLLRQHGADPDEASAQRKIDAAHRIAAAYARPPMGEPAIVRVEDLYDDSGLPR
ncbi:type II toxin-antitoxin system VapB family antitoxin [Nocardioidaceae bacterium]|nr:type II toxin-antitoxin system VapB family antitoxin [Nocardioidaceae bacterium]